VIAPGLGAMQDYLGRRTALLPTIELKEPRAAIGKSTVEAMQAGAVFGYRGLVREILTRLRAEMHGDPLIVATGGDAALIAQGLPEIGHVDPDLTLEGIRLAAVRNLR
jgi:type III pantothenate kinase